MSTTRWSDGSEPQAGPTRPGRDVCPARYAGLLSTPLRRLFTDSRRILHGSVEPGDTAVDLGCGPGFFTLPLAEMVGDDGSVVAVDVQAEMLRRLQVRAERSGLAGRIRPHLCPAHSLDLDVSADFVLAFWMMHEAQSAERLLGEVHGVLKEGGRLLLVEPRRHVDKQAFERTVMLAAAAEFTPADWPHVRFSRAVLLERR